MRTQRSVLYLAQGAAIAAIYFVLTYALAPISSGLFQCRIAEALCVLPCFTPAAVPGLFLGCLIANLLAGSLPIDVALGSLATLISAALTYWIGKRLSRVAQRVLAQRELAMRVLAPLPAVVCNAVIVGWVLAYAYGVAPYGTCALYVGAGQAVACYALGVPLMMVLERYREKIFGAPRRIPGGTPDGGPEDGPPHNRFRL